MRERASIFRHGNTLFSGLKILLSAEWFCLQSTQIHFMFTSEQIFSSMEILLSAGWLSFVLNPHKYMSYSWESKQVLFGMEIILSAEFLESTQIQIGKKYYVCCKNIAIANGLYCMCKVQVQQQMCHGSIFSSSCGAADAVNTQSFRNSSRAIDGAGCQLAINSIVDASTHHTF